MFFLKKWKKCKKVLNREPFRQNGYGLSEPQGKSDEAFEKEEV